MLYAISRRVRSQPRRRAGPRRTLQYTFQQNVSEIIPRCT